MIQRIQSIWLLLAACAFTLCFLFPTARYVFPLAGDGTNITQIARTELNLFPKAVEGNPLQAIEQCAPEVNFSQQFVGFHTWPLIVIAIAVIALCLVTIFLYKNRMLQVKLAATAFLLGALYVFLIFIWAVYGYAEKTADALLLQSSKADIVWSVGTWCPIVALLFLFLARNAIQRDEKKVREADRLR